MGQQKTEQTTTIPARGAAEQNILQLLQQLAQRGAGQLGDLTQLAGGNIGGPTSQDLELIAQSIERARKMAQGQLQTTGNILGAQTREDLTARGVSGSSAEVVQNLLNQLGTQQSIAQSVLQAQQAGGEALLQLPFQRAATQLSANQQLFNQILGAGAPALQVPLQERLAQGTTTQTQSGFNLGQLAQLGASAVGGGGFLNSLVQGLFQRQNQPSQTQSTGRTVPDIYNLG